MALGQQKEKNQTYSKDKKLSWYAENRGNKQATFGRKNNSFS